MEGRRSRLIREAYEKGFQYEKIYHGCGQCTLGALTNALLLSGTQFPGLQRCCLMKVL